MKTIVLSALTLVTSVAVGAGKETKPVAPAKAAAADVSAVAKGNKPNPAPKATQLDLLKGGWTACRPMTNETGEVLTKGPTLSIKDSYDRKSASTFTQTFSSAKDKDCKKITSENRATWECEEFSPELLTCKAVKREERKSGGKWKELKSESDNMGSMKLAIVQKDPQTISLSITSDESEETETFELKKAGK